MVKRITNASNAIEFLKTLEDMNRWSKKYIVLDCPTVMAKEIVVYHVRDLSLGRRTYHYLLSGLVSNKNDYSCGFFIRRMIFFLSSFFVLFDFLCFVNFLSFLRIFFSFHFAHSCFALLRFNVDVASTFLWSCFDTFFYVIATFSTRLLACPFTK